MKNQSKINSVFDAALRQASWDFSREMGYTTNDRNKPVTNPPNRGMLSKIGEFIKLISVQQVKMARRGKFKW